MVVFLVLLFVQSRFLSYQIAHDSINATSETSLSSPWNCSWQHKCNLLMHAFVLVNLSWQNCRFSYDIDDLINKVIFNVKLSISELGKTWSIYFVVVLYMNQPLLMLLPCNTFTWRIGYRGIMQALKNRLAYWWVAASELGHQIVSLLPVYFYDHFL